MPFGDTIGKWWASNSTGCVGALYEEHGFLYDIVGRFIGDIPFNRESNVYMTGLAEEGTVVYALKDRSQLNTLILDILGRKGRIPAPVYSAGVNMMLWQPLFRSLGCILWSVKRYISRSKTTESPPESGLLERIRQGETVVVHMGGSEFKVDASVEEALRVLCRASTISARPVFLVPMVIVYGRRRERERESLLNILFGQTDDTGPLRRIVTLLRYSGQITVLPAEAVDVGAFVKNRSGRTEDELVRELRGEVMARIDEERAVIHGPVLKSRDEIMDMVLTDPRFVEKMEEMAREGGKKDLQALVKEARKYLKEIAADYSDAYIEFWYRVLTWLWNNIYDGVVVDSEGMVRIRNIAKKMPFVIIPCHRSHIDYLLLSYVFYKNHIQLPFIAAGINMAFGPFGHIFRKSGAFFMRRSFRGNPLYGEVFAKYLKILIKEGLPIEFFIEGGRSRTGKMVMPKYGLLSMIISAYLEKVTEDVALIPVYIGYDRIIEEKTYLEELGGGQKTQEKTTDVIMSSRILRKRFGRVYVNIGEPLFLRSYLSSQEKPVEKMTVEERQRLYRKIGYEIVLSINRVSVVTPFSLVSAGLLSHDRRGIGHGELMNILDEFYEFLTQRRVNLAATFAHREKAINEALNLFAEAGFISPITYGEEQDEDLAETVYSLEEERRLNLEYYKNNILHYFLPLSFVAVSMLSHRDDVVSFGRIMEDYRFFKSLFWREFIFDDRRDDGEEVHDALAYLHDRRMVTLLAGEDGAKLEVKGRGRTNLRYYAGLIANYLESYWVVFRGTAYLRKGPRSERDWLKYLHKLGAVMLKKGEIRRAEALSQANYLNAVVFLEDQGVIHISEAPDKKDRRDAKLYHLKDDRMMLDTLRRRLFRYL